MINNLFYLDFVNSMCRLKDFLMDCFRMSIDFITQLDTLMFYDPTYMSWKIQFYLNYHNKLLFKLYETINYVHQRPGQT